MTSVEMMSSVKRDRIKKQEKLKLKKDMRAALPVLNREQIRRFRLPYHEAILLELREKGFTSSEEFLRQLIQYQEDLRREHGPDSVVSSRPRLLACKEQIDMLYKGLSKAEEAHYNYETEKECDELIALGVTFGLGSRDWWWLGEQLLMQAVNVSDDFQKDGGKREALSKYLYGKFLLENIMDMEKAKEQLTIARNISTGKPWTAKQELQTKQDSIFVESCILLYKAILAEVKDVMIYDSLKASRLCALARKRATDACNHQGEAEALMLQGLCEMNAGDASAAAISFIKVLALYTKTQNIEAMCEARIHIALAYLKIGRFADTLNQLQALLQFAEAKNLPYYVAQSHRFLGEYYLNQGLPSAATPLLIKALNIFHELEDMLNQEQARNLAAISAGQELIPKYVELILKSGKPGLKGLHYVMKLVRWKDTRELFWSESDDNSSGTRSLDSLETSHTVIPEGEGEHLRAIEETAEELFDEEELNTVGKSDDSISSKDNLVKSFACESNNSVTT